MFRTITQFATQQVKRHGMSMSLRQFSSTAAPRSAAVAPTSFTPAPWAVRSMAKMPQMNRMTFTPVLAQRFMTPLGVNFITRATLGGGLSATAAAAVVAQKPTEVCPITPGTSYGYDIYGYDRDYTKQIRAAEKDIRKAILDTIEDEKGEYDGHGSYAPLYVRLAWHSSGTYDRDSNTGGSNGGCMRFQPEAGHGANNGLHIARERLEQIKTKFPFISYADLYTLAGVVAAEEMNDELHIPWRPGRSDYTENKHYKVDRVRLPDGMLGADHMRDVFTKQMGFTDREITALIGAHAVGLVHADRSGFLTRPWTYSPTTLRNNFYTTLLEQKWELVDGPNGTKHYTNVPQDDLIMIPADYAFVTDPIFFKYVQEYAKDEDQWAKDFSKAFAKLLELGVTFVE